MEGNFFKPPSGESTTKRLKEVRTDSLENIQETELSERGSHGVKHEAYVLSTYLIESFHKATYKIFEEDPAFVLDMTVRMKEDPFSKALRVEDGRITLAADNTLTEEQYLKGVLDENIIPTMYLRAFQQALLNIRNNFEGTREEAVYRRLDKLLYRSGLRYTADAKSKRIKPHAADHFITRGAFTAGIESWNVIFSVILQYNQQFRQELTKDTLEALMPDIKRILNQTAALHITDLNSFSAFRKALFQNISLQESSWEPALSFTGEASSPRVALNREFIDRYEEYIAGKREYKECAHGCPARSALTETEEGKRVNVISEIADVYQQLAEDILLPYQALLTRSASEKFTTFFSHE